MGSFNLMSHMIWSNYSINTTKDITEFDPNITEFDNSKMLVAGKLCYFFPHIGDFSMSKSVVSNNGVSNISNWSPT